MRKSNKSLNIHALILVLAGFLFTTSNIAFADEKKSEEAANEVATDTDKKADGDKKKKDEEPECE